MTKQKIIQNILHNTKLCLKPSRVCNGVGLFTILPIKKGSPDGKPFLFSYQPAVLFLYHQFLFGDRFTKAV